MSELPLIVPELVVLDQNLGGHKNDVITHLSGVVAATGRADSAEGLAEDALAREGQAPTGQPGGIGIPHCRSTHVNTTSLGFARLAEPVDFGAKDGPADLIFLIAAADGEGKEHLKLLAKLARAMARKTFLASLREATTAEEVVAIVEEVLAPKKTEPAAGDGAAAQSAGAGEGAAAAGAAGAGAEATGQGGGARRLVAVTSCPTGIAHTYMAAEALEQAAKEMGHELTVETQGSSGGTALTQEQIDAADAVVFAVGVGVRDRERFGGKPGVEAGVNVGVSDPSGLITKALAAADDPNGHRIAGGGGSGSGESAGGSGEGQSWGRRLQQALMTGVSYMIPFVAAGGLLTALGFALGGAERVAEVGPTVVGENTLFNLPADGGLALYLGAIFFTVGGFAMSFLVPALSGYIAYALAGRPGIAPGFVGGAIAIAVDAGFIGGLVTGLVAGVIAMWIASIKVPRWLAGLMPVVIIPLVTTLLVGLLMYLLLGRPLAALMEVLQDGLNSMTGTSAVLLGVILGLMMCFDLGGPVNKAAYLFATAGLAQGTDAAMMIMAAVMAGGMVPPLALALSTTVRGNLYSEAERENGRSAWLLGASFISEGAIPFAAADPLRVIPSMMVGGAITGGLTMALGVGLNAPHGGIFVVPSMTNPFGFLIALVAGVVVSATIVTILKAQRQKSLMAAAKAEAEGADAPTAATANA
ncbi:PTS lactose transporter subunit IIC [Kocuria coralli]|uniref:PTS lactose transporter subunit IIC n=1 Tax=Kocuria coralli TaxID=1461025 RepID=A0A5J5KX49_9MICC|nr:fructose-specific PTS transporter subunit EIIC [Kocuria coralli]KAA9394214.1 PTS lactose transporter subunit IIC [Kocuria coralli]